MRKKVTKSIGRLVIRLSFQWYDMWIGAYYSQKYGILYICPLPMIVFEFQVIPKRGKYGELG